MAFRQLSFRAGSPPAVVASGAVSTTPPDIPVIILCGGKGLRLSGHGSEIPKALVEVGNKPILWHVMKGYSHFGYRKFVLCLGHLSARIKEFFLEGRITRMGDVTLKIGEKGDEIVAHSTETDWEITFAETGVETNTGGRIHRAARYLGDAPTFLATYVDGLADLDLNALLAFHREHGKIATLTSVNPLSQFGLLDLDADSTVRRFVEKPRLEAWINGGFFVFERAILELISKDGDLERDTLAALAQRGELKAYRHKGFWTCMDTYKDTLNLNQLWESDRAPWQVWP